MRDEETVYSAEALLRSPRRFAAAAARDLRVAPAAAWRMWLRDLQARHRQSWLGYLWLVLPPTAIALTWAYLDHAGLLRVADTGIPYLAYVLTGTMLWQVFTDALRAPLRRLSAGRATLTKTRLPHETWMLAGALDVATGFVVRVPILVAVIAITGTPLSTTVLLVPLGVAALATLGLALGVALAPIGLLYDDVEQGLTVVTMLWFFLTPVVYAWPAQGIGAELVTSNPVTPLLVATRGWLTGTPGVDPAYFAAVFACSLVLLAVALVIYRLAQPHLVVRL